MAVFNGANYLEEQLSSLAAQSVLPGELVVCDDASTDRTVEIVRRFASSAPFPVHLHLNPSNLGYRANFMKAAGLCRSEIVFFCDQDDRWSPRKIATILCLFEDPEVALVFHQADLIDAQGKSLPGRLYGERGAFRYEPLSFPPWETRLGFTQAFRRTLTGLDRYWTSSLDPTTADQPLAHDQWYLFLAGVLGTIAYCPDALASYRQHASNAFGVGQYRVPLARRIARTVKEAQRSLLRREQSARLRANVLEAGARLLAGQQRDRCLAGAAVYDELASRCAARADIYSAGTFGRRIGLLKHLFASYGYGPDVWKFGRGALAMDATIGLSGIGRGPMPKGN